MISRYNYLPLLLLVVVSIILASAGFSEKCPRDANIRPLKQNVFYIGVDNPIYVSISGIRYDKITVETDNGTVSSTEAAGLYNVRVDSLAKTNITVSYWEDGKLTKGETFSFRNKKIPDPRTYINSIRTEGIVLKENIASIVGVFTRMENFDFDCSFKPQSFSMSVIEDGEWKEYKAVGPELTPEMKTALTKCEEEDKILFHNVMTKGPAGDVRMTNAVIITVK